MRASRHEPTDDDYVTRGLRSALRLRTAAPTELPRAEGYAIEQSIGCGGVGEVYRARELALDRTVALKVLAVRHAHDVELLVRLREEARICGSLQHPGVVPVYAAGLLDDGRPFFTMRLVEGETLAARLAACQMPAQGQPAHLATLLQVCQTIAYAHANGVVHGDLKPGNVMVGRFGETQVMDWGFARALRGELRDLVDTGRALGSPAYMAPEQAREAQVLTPRTDVFGLGGMLLEVLTGMPTYTGADRAAVWELAARGDTAPALERLQHSGADRDLVALASDCLAVDAAARPPDAAAVAERLAAHLHAVQARARALESAIERTRRSRRVVAAIAAITVTAVIAIAAVALWWQHDRHLWRSAAERRVVAAMAEARQLSERARAQPVESLAHWSEAIAAARHASVSAESLTDAARESARSLLVELEAGAAQAQRQRAMAVWLDEVRPHLPADRGVLADDDYRDAFAAFGLDVDGDLERAAATLAQSPLAPRLLAALDDWMRLRRQLGASASRALRTLADRVDTDPWRRRLRAALACDDRAELLALATSDALATTSAAAVTALAVGLAQIGERPRALQVLRDTVHARPPDVTMMHELARLLDPQDAATRSEALALRMAAASARPDSPHLLTDLAQTLLASGDAARAEQVLLRATRADPSYTRAWRYLAWARLSLKRARASAQAADHVLASQDQDAEAHRLRAAAALQLGDFAVGAAHARRAVALGAHWQADLLLCLACERLGDLPGALAALDALITRAPEVAFGRILRGPLLVRLGRFAEAVEQTHQNLRAAMQLGDERAVQRCQEQIRRAELLAATAQRFDGWGVDGEPVADAELGAFAEVAWIRGDALVAHRLHRRLAASAPAEFVAQRRMAIEAAAALLGTAGATEVRGIAGIDAESVRGALLEWARAEVLGGYLQIESGTAPRQELVDWAVSVRRGPTLAALFAAADDPTDPHGAGWRELRDMLDRVIAAMVVEGGSRR